MKDELKEDHYFGLIFKLGMYWRIIYAIFKFVFGIILLKFINSNFTDLFYHVMGHEIIEDKNDIFIRAIKSIFDNHTFYVTYFVAIYFIFWGAVDAFLSFNLLKLNLWSYPVSLTLITVFTLYEIYRFTYTHSLILLSIIFIDIFLIWIIFKEYKKLKLVRVK
jgi:uncharacterized membrane protein